MDQPNISRQNFNFNSMSMKQSVEINKPTAE